MCGIAGIVHWGERNDAPALAARMASTMRHRGPDDTACWSDADIALGFVRLSIVDIDGGAQPMRSADGAVTVVFNGEIYNHVELRRELETRGHVFRTDHSDTEVLVHGYREWGEGLARRLNGMFAFAVWDQPHRRLLLAHRYGIKPLYLARLPSAGLAFASEVRPLLAAGLTPARPNPAALMEYLSFQNTLGTETVFEGVESFPPATREIVTRSGAERARYWRYDFTRDAGAAREELIEEHRTLLERAVHRQLQADVPVMSYLSGGIDSSAITAMAVREAPELRAYSCLFDLTGVGDDRISDEREFSRAMARHLDIDHVELELSGEVLRETMDSVVGSLEEPRMGMSYVNYLIARRVAADGKVVLSGMGGDELHGGYLYRLQALARFRTRPRGLRARLRAIVRARRGPDLAGTLRLLLNFPVARDRRGEALGPELVDRAGDVDVDARIAAVLEETGARDPWDAIMTFDARAYLHGLLVLEDKLSMAHSLETRVPLLDNDLVDFVQRVPWELLCDGQTGKILFRDSVRPLVPAAVADKPKMGFGPPDASWYRGPLRTWVEHQLAPKRIAARGLIEPGFVRRVLDEHFSGERDNVAIIWSLLTLESWCRVFGMYGGSLEGVEA